MAKITHFPNIRSVSAANNYWDPMHNSIFEVVFELPAGIANNKYGVGSIVDVLGEQVKKVTGLDALQKTAAAGEQKFFGASASYLNPTLDSTFAELTVELNLNIRNSNDATVFRVFKDWSKLGYDLSNGNRSLMKDYICKSLKINEANRDGTVWRTVTFQRVMLIEVTGLDDLDYTNNEARTLTVKFRADLWDENIATGVAQQ